MAETKNTFIKSKMNQDLDQRLVPNGEYREGINIAVSQAEGADVGTLENVLGNVLITDLDLNSTVYFNAEIIGYFADDQNQEVYLFVTNYTDTSVDQVSNYPPDNVLCQIWKRNVQTNENLLLVEGKFLNFSLTHPIIGINLIEDLLFWTDNRNQPRKINVNAANPSALTNPTYYTNDDQINVAKYYPFEPISLVKDYVVDYTFFSRGTGSPQYDQYEGEVVPTSAIGASGLTVEILEANATTGELEQIRIVDQGQGYYNGQYVTIAPKIGNAQIQLVVEEASTMKDTCTERLPVSASYQSVSGTINQGGTYTLGTLNNGVALSDVDYTGALVKINAGVTASPYLARVTAYNASTPSIDISWPNAFPTSISGVTGEIIIGVNPDYDANWPGDCQFLKDKFVRFAYRFKFEDNEYSLISPFTQPCFIPKQNGYFLSEDRAGIPVLDTQKAYEDTDNNIMQNMVTNIDIDIPCPEFLDASVSNNFNNITKELHVKEIDIIYKDDAGSNLEVVDTLIENDFSDLESNKLTYSYQSRKPKKTLPSNEITRVSDKVPIRALAQEVTGNRVIYGNYVDGYTAMNTLDYEVSAVEKPEDTSLKKEYPNHTLKQNRSYQVGVVLVDRYGRNSDVILSSLDISKSEASTIFYSGSTVFHPFYSADPGLINPSPLSTWNGDSLRVKFNSKIPLTIPQAGYPGLFLGYISDPASNLYGGAGYTSFVGLATTGGTGTGLTVNITIDVSKFAGPPPLGIVQSVTINDEGVGYKQGDVITITGGLPTIQATFVYNPSSQPNLTGWYSYKIVVKQTEQDYYNVYLPGIVNGNLNTDGLTSKTTANISLFADNINKVPKDLTGVGPSQTNYNSTENLSLRVNNTTSFSSIQNYPGTDLEKVTQISELTDLGIDVGRRSLKQDGNVLAGNDTFAFDSFNDKILPGAAILSVFEGTTERINSSEGYFVKSYFANNPTGSTVVLNKVVTPPIATNSTWTFGPPGVVYNAGNNPLIGVLSTSKQIGVSEQEGFKTQLSVAETTPVESLLDIYYETTSSGSISDLNLAISQGIPAAIPVKTTNIVFSLNEGQTGPVACTNSFTLLANNNLPITGSNVKANIVSVFDSASGDRTSEFDLTDNNNGTFSVVLTKPPGEGYFVGSSNVLTTFNFNLELTNGTNIIQSQFSGSIDNERAVYQGTTKDDGSVSVPKSGNSVFGRPSDGLDFECFNGSGDVSLREQQISWEIVNAYVRDGKNSETLIPNPSGGSFYQPSPGYVDDPNAAYDPSYQLRKDENVTNLFNPSLSLQNNKYIGSKTKVEFIGLDGTGYQIQGQGSYFPVFTSQLVEFIEFEVQLRAVDRNGNGVAAEASTSGASGGAYITLTVRAEN